MQTGKWKYTLLKADGTKNEIGISSGKMTLEELQKSVGGKIELVNWSFRDQIKYRYSSVFDAYCNEEGKLENQPRNKHFRPTDFDVMVGDVIVEENMAPEYDVWLENQEIVYKITVEVNDVVVFEDTYATLEDLYGEGRKPERSVEAELQQQFEDEYPEDEEL